MCDSSRMAKQENDWRAESDHRTLTDAAAIQADKDRMTGVKKHHRKVSKQHKMVGKALVGGRR